MFWQRFYGTDNNVGLVSGVLMQTVLVKNKHAMIHISLLASLYTNAVSRTAAPMGIDVSEFLISKVGYLLLYIF